MEITGERPASSVKAVLQDVRLRYQISSDGWQYATGSVGHGLCSAGVDSVLGEELEDGTGMSRYLDRSEDFIEDFRYMWLFKYENSIEFFSPLCGNVIFRIHVT